MPSRRKNSPPIPRLERLNSMGQNMVKTGRKGWGAVNKSRSPSPEIYLSSNFDFENMSITGTHSPQPSARMSEIAFKSASGFPYPRNSFAAAGLATSMMSGKAPGALRNKKMF